MVAVALASLAVASWLVVTSLAVPLLVESSMVVVASSLTHMVDLAATLAWVLLAFGVPMVPIHQAVAYLAYHHTLGEMALASLDAVLVAAIVPLVPASSLGSMVHPVLWHMLRSVLLHATDPVHMLLPAVGSRYQHLLYLFWTVSQETLPSLVVLVA